MTNRTNPADDPGATWTLCPRCALPRLRADRPALNAMSRVADVHICSPCGSDEAVRDFDGAGPVPVDEWPIEGVQP